MAVSNASIAGALVSVIAADTIIFLASAKALVRSLRWAFTFGLTGLIIWFHFGLGMYGQGFDEIDADWRYYVAAGIALAAAVIPYLAFERQERKRRWAQPAN